MVTIKALPEQKLLSTQSDQNNVQYCLTVLSNFTNQHTIQPVLRVGSREQFLTQSLYSVSYFLLSSWSTQLKSLMLAFCLSVFYIHSVSSAAAEVPFLWSLSLYFLFDNMQRVLNQWRKKSCGCVYAFKNCQAHFCLAFVSRDISMYPNCERVHLCSCEQQNVQMVINKDIGLNSLTIKY